MAERRKSPVEPARGLPGSGGVAAGPRRGGPPARVEVVSPARRAAFRVLFEVGASDAHSDELLHASGPDAALEGLSDADRNLATALVMGVLRWQIALDRRLATLFTRPDSTLADEVMIALRLGAFQLLHMDRVPAHAALSESVALVRAVGHEYATGMVNAVLRKVAGGPKTEPGKVFETPAAAGERLGHPGWLVERWTKLFGRTRALAICEAGQHEPEDAGVLAADERLPVMDEGSRLVAELASLAAGSVADRALRVWDCCAAPGGKTAVMTTRLTEAGLPVEVLATDVSPRRLRAMEARLGVLAASAGTGGPVRCLVADATALPAGEGLFDLILCDVPCSGTGTLARNPEIRLRLQPTEFARQAVRQRRLLQAALRRLAPGGRLVYSTCSLEPEECSEVVRAVLPEFGGSVTLLPVDGLLDELRARDLLLRLDEGAAEAGDLRTLPGVHAMDGFFAAILARA